MPTWTTPKTDWVGTDSFSASDWNRIDKNVAYIADRLSKSYSTNVKSDFMLLTSYERNVVTNALVTYYRSMYSSWDHRYIEPRIDFGSAWNSVELNAIESMLLNMKLQLDGELPQNDFYRCGDEICCGETFSVGLL